MSEVSPQHGTLRVLRGATLASLSALLAVAAHVAGGGELPSAALVVIIATVLAGAATVLADRRRGPLAVLVGVAAVQVAMHLLLTALDGHPHAAAGGPGPAGSGGMVLWHAVAVLVTAAVLARAESAIFALAGALRRLTRWLPVAPAARPAAPSARIPDTPVALCRALFATELRLRGPPVVS